MTLCCCLAPVNAGADVVLEWNAIAVSTTGAQNPFAQARYLAIVQLAVFEAVNSVTGEYEPYLGSIVAPAGASAEAAAVAAAHGVLVHYFPLAAPTLDAARASSLAGIPDNPDRSDGIAAGEAAAAAMIALRIGDGSETPAFYLPSSSDPGQWQVTAPGCPLDASGMPLGGVLLHWGNVRTFAIRSANDFLLRAPPELSSPQYAKDYNEVKAFGRVDSTMRTQERSVVARFYAMSSPGLLLNSAARQISTSKGRSLPENARALALLNVAISDALVASFNTKYHYNLWRPVTAIREGQADGNGRTEADATWAPYITTPCFPGYPSNHASGTNAGAEILRRLYGAAGHSFELSNPALPGVTLAYTAFNQICNDVDDARVYGGIHFRFEQDAGAHLGRDVAEDVYKHNLRPRNGHD